MINVSVKLCIGKQYRTISCSWGNATCLGYRNGREEQNICVDTNIRDNFCNTAYSSSWELWDWAWRHNPPPKDNEKNKHRRIS